MKIMKKAALRSTTFLSVISIFASTHAMAQDAAPVEDDTADTIVVTGSRIVRPGNDTPIAVNVRTAEDLFRTGGTNVGDELSKLPQLAPTYTQATSLGGGNAIGTAGLNILDLRSLGVSRTLTLVNGRRHITAIEGDFLIDTNTIPSDLIERVDVVTGGSSAVYGSDAMAGVVNFVLKRNFEGLTANAQAGLSSRGDRSTYRLAATYGKNFADGRGNIAVSLEYNRAKPINYTQRDGQTGAFSGRNQFQLVDNPELDNTIPDRTFLRGVHSFGYADTGAFIPYVGTNIRSCAGGVAAACLPSGVPRAFYFEPSGALTEFNYGTDFRPVGSGNNQGGSGSTLNNTGVLIPGLERYVANVIGHYDVSDAFKPYFEAKFVRVKSTQTSAPSFSQGGRQGPLDALGNPLSPSASFTTSPISLDNAFLTPGSRQLIESLMPAGTTFFNVNRNNIDLGARGENNRRDTYRIVVGAEGTFNEDWHYDVSVNYGKLKTRYLFTNDRIEDRFYNSLDAVLNGAGQAVCRINQTTITDAACRPISLIGNQSQADREAAIAYFSRTSMRTGQASQFNVTASLSGDSSQLFELPGGPVRFALGGEYRREKASYRYDDVVTSGQTFLNAIQPFNPPAFEVKEAFGEIEIPILKDTPFFNELTINGAGRVADYKGAVGTVWAYNAGAIYSPVQGVRFRANYSKSVRAPTLADLYTTPSQDYRSVNDPCDVLHIGSGTATRAANCLAAGVPVGFENSVTRSQTLPIFSGGNPNLTEERSRSWTYGIVLTPTFLPGLSITADYYDIKISNVVSPVGTQDILDGCYDAPDLNNQFCALINPRNADGTFQTPDALLESTLNFAALRAKGIDMDIAYNHRFSENDKLSVRLTGSWVKMRNDYPYLDSPEVPDRVKGELGSPIWRASFQADWTHKDFSLGYTLRYVGRQATTDWEMMNETSGVADTPYNPYYIDTAFYPKRIYHDISANYNVNDQFSLYGGVNNLTDKLPPYGLLGLGGGTVDGIGNDGLYDNIGRFFYVGVRVKM